MLKKDTERNVPTKKQKMPTAYHPTQDIACSSKATGYLNYIDPLALRHYIAVVLLLLGYSIYYLNYLSNIFLHHKRKNSRRIESFVNLSFC